MQESGQQLAAIDLGSNSFHMVVAWQDQNEIRLQESLSEKVQLGAGLGDDQRITDEACERGLECLARFAQRIRGIPRGRVRVVGTNTLRVARNAADFLDRAEALLGHDIEIVAGREEARLIYLGVSHYLPDNGAAQRLVVDIGGGSTEFIIGSGFESLETESLHMGCVSYSSRFFSQGDITEKAFDKAVTAARREVLTIESNYRAIGWQQAVGASGTVKAIAQVCEENDWSQSGITLEGLEKIRKRLIRFGHMNAIDLKGLRDDRAPIFPAGVAILLGIFRQLGLASMEISPGALREGLLYDLVGRAEEEDVRERSLSGLMERYRVDRAQAMRVAASADGLWLQVAEQLGLEAETWRDALRWAAMIHEVGLAVSHTQFHKHGAYLISNSDLPGFSRQEQQILALLVRGHRRKIPVAVFEQTLADPAERLACLHLCLLLRLAIRLHHARNDQALPSPELKIKAGQFWLAFPDGWIEDHPLTCADFEEEQGFFAAAGLGLLFS